MNQRHKFFVYAKVLPVDVWEEYGVSGPEDMVRVDGVGAGVWRLHSEARALRNAKLEFRDVTINGKWWTPWHAPRKSRKQKKRSMPFLVKICDTFWLEGSRLFVGLRGGIVGFSAVNFPTPGLPPEDKKTTPTVKVGLGRALSLSGRARPQEERMWVSDGVPTPTSGSPQAAFSAKELQDAKAIFNRLRSHARSGKFVGDEQFIWEYFKDELARHGCWQVILELLAKHAKDVEHAS